MNKSDKIVDLYRQFVKTIIDNKLNDFLLKNGFDSIAIYGYGSLGQSLHYYLQSKGFCVSYVIDMNDLIKNKYNSVAVYGEEKKYPDVDVIIITTAFDGESIQEYLTGRVSCPLLLLEDLI